MPSSHNNRFRNTTYGAPVFHNWTETDQVKSDKY